MRLCATVILVGLLCSWAVSPEAALQKRAGGMVYDTVLDITWQQNAGSSGDLDYDAASTWVDNLVFGGFCEWRLPRLDELQHMYFDNLGGTVGTDLTGDHGLIADIQPVYWSSTTTRGGGQPPPRIWVFDFGSGQESTVVVNPPPPPPVAPRFAVWAVHPGDVRNFDNMPTHFEIDTTLVSGTIITDPVQGLISEADIRQFALTLHFPRAGPRVLDSGENASNFTVDSSSLATTPVSMVFDYDDSSGSVRVLLSRDPRPDPIVPAAVVYWQLTHGVEEIFWGCCIPGSFELVDREILPRSGLVAIGVNPLGMCDTDFDQIAYDDDNCTAVANADQRDTDGDQIGNACDPDISVAIDCLINFQDLAMLREAFFSMPGASNWNPDADFNGDGQVDGIDLGTMKSSFFEAPGPSGLLLACRAQSN